MSENEDLDLLMDAVSDHCDVAHQAGNEPGDVAAVAMLAVAQFLVDTMEMDDAQEAFRSISEGVVQRMPLLVVSTEVAH